MKNVINFKSEKELTEYLKSKRISIIGEGSEGICYKSHFDKLAYKIIDSDDNSVSYIPEYNMEDIITEDDIYLSSFLFPKTLITVNGKFRGYTSKAIDKNYFDINEMLENISNIQIKKLLKAYKVMLKDIVVLSEQHISIYDLPHNLLFDGEKLYAIDTCCYYRTDNSNVLESNIKSLNCAIKTIFDEYLSFQDDKQYISDDIDILEYLSEIDKYLHKTKTKTLHNNF